jgi:probable F420-dependent oxidoreductase
VKLGIFFANTLFWAGPRAAELGRAAEEVGCDALFTVEHVVLPENFASPYPYSKDGKMPGGDSVWVPDPLVWLSYVAAATSRIKLGTGILILPQRNPVLLAKEVATLQHLSGGRLLLGVGIGWLKEEFEALGADFKNRARIAEEAIEALRALLSSNPASYHGRFVSFERLKLNVPPDTPLPPVIVGGHSEGAAKRAAALGDGFFPACPDFEDVRRYVTLMRQEAEKLGRDPRSIEVTCFSPPEEEEVAKRLELGVDRIVTHPFVPDIDGLKRHLESYQATLARLA